jgi:hypothetical protein
MTTRFERIVKLLDTEYVPFQEPPTEDVVRKVLEIADSRILWTPAEVCAYIGRLPPVWANWQARGSHDVPAPAFRTSSGAMYDAEDVQEWASRPECYALLGDGSEARKATWKPGANG